MDKVIDRSDSAPPKSESSTDLAKREIPTVIVEPRPVETTIARRSPAQTAELIDRVLALLTGLVNLALKWVEVREQQAEVQALQERRSSAPAIKTSPGSGRPRRRHRRRQAGRRQNHT
ncbi:MAG: hypothetical protein ACP5GX_01360 [Anaerolineae bacterium]